MSLLTTNAPRQDDGEAVIDVLLDEVARAEAADLPALLVRAAAALSARSIGAWRIDAAAPVRIASLPVDAPPPGAIAQHLGAQRTLVSTHQLSVHLDAALWSCDEVVGLLHVERDAPSSWTVAERAVSAAIADRIGLLLEREAVQAETARALNERTEDALRALESYRTIFDSSNDAIFLHDLETGAVLDANRTACEVNGVTLEELRARGPQLLGHGPAPFSEQLALAYIGKAASGEPQRFEWCTYHQGTGEQMWVEVSLQRVTIRGEGRLLALVRDIRERKRTEQELHRANEELEQRVAARTEELRASEEHFRRLIENSSDQLMIVDTTGAITYVGPSVERLLGYSQDEMLGKRPPDLVHPEDVPDVMASLERIVTQPGEVHTIQYRILHRDGSWRVFETIGKTLAPHTAAEGVVANGRDVTERQRAEEALREATAAAEQANRAKSEFLSRMSHELRTPMNSILGFAQVLESAELPARLEKCVQHILRAGHHLLQLINEVLEIARIEAGRHNLSLEPVRVGSVLQEAIGLARPMANQSRVELEYAGFAHEDVYVRADRQRLAQVLLNLLANAIKYNRAGGRVRLSCAPAPAVADGPARLRIRVEDTGPGIPEHQRDQLFTPFSRLGAEDSGIEGTGLGLALSQRLAEAMHGSLVLERSSSAGSVFCIELQQTQSPLEELDENERTPRRRGAVAHEAATLLYIEDNLANLSLVETILWERPQWRTIPALQGRIGVELAREHVPDLILLDLHLPDMHGEEVLSRLRAEPRTSAIPVVVISADATDSTIQRLTAAGAAGFLTKPLDVSAFLDTLERLLTPPSR